MELGLIISGLVGAASSLFSGFLGSDAAKNAANSQASADKASLDLQARTLDQARKDSLPWLEAGRAGLQRYLGEIGVTDKNADGTPFVSTFEKSPSYDFEVKEGEKGVLTNLARLGMKNSGAALKSLSDWRQNKARGEYGNYLTRLSNIGTGGQQQVSSDNAMSMNSAVNQGNTLSSMGNATASGYINSANSLSGAIGNFANQFGKGLAGFNFGSA